MTMFFMCYVASPSIIYSFDTAPNAALLITRIIVTAIYDYFYKQYERVHEILKEPRECCESNDITNQPLMLVI